MNERIKELADRLWRVHPSDIDAMGLKTRTEFYEQELEKFAELIVKECMTIVSKAGNSKAEVLNDLEELIWSR